MLCESQRPESKSSYAPVSLRLILTGSVTRMIKRFFLALLFVCPSAQSSSSPIPSHHHFSLFSDPASPLCVLFLLVPEMEMGLPCEGDSSINALCCQINNSFTKPSDELFSNPTLAANGPPTCTVPPVLPPPPASVQGKHQINSDIDFLKTAHTLNRAQWRGNDYPFSESLTLSLQPLLPGCSQSLHSTLLLRFPWRCRCRCRCRVDTGAHPLRLRDGWRRSPRLSRLNRPHLRALSSPPSPDPPPCQVSRCPVRQPYQPPQCPLSLSPLAPCPNLLSLVPLHSQVKPQCPFRPCQYHRFL